ncbi:hypothetical protein AAY473_015927 [Plecturocebus cupreus]
MGRGQGRPPRQRTERAGVAATGTQEACPGREEPVASRVTPWGGGAHGEQRRLSAGGAQPVEGQTRVGDEPEPSAAVCSPGTEPQGPGTAISSPTADSPFSSSVERRFHQARVALQPR